MGTILLNPCNGCWIDFFDSNRFSGNRMRLRGPAEFAGLRVREENFGHTISSISVGPCAYVQCYKAHDFRDTIFWLLPNQSIESLADLDCPDNIDAIRLYDRPPFAHEPGYAAYMLWAASYLAKMKE